MEDYLRNLGHARDGFDGKVAEAVDGPGVLVGFDEAAAVWRISEEIKSKLSVRFDGVDATREEEPSSRISVFVDVKEVQRAY